MIATGVAKLVRYKAESAWGTAPGATGAQALRRVTSDLALKKQTFESNEISGTLQRRDFRHGPRSVAGSINGELSPGTWEDFLAAAVRRAFTAVSALTGLSITISGSGPTFTVARSAGDWIAGGIKIGQVVRLTAGTFNAGNINKNLFVLGVTALNLTVMPLNGAALVAEGPIASATLSVPGKISYAPATGHTDQSFAIEHFFSDLVQSELYLGCKVNQLDINLPPVGMATITLALMGKDVTTGTAAYYTTPTGETTTPILAAANGILIAQSGAIAIVTGMSASVKGNMTAEAVVGSNVYPDIAEGRITVDGQITALFESVALRDYFLNETEVALAVAMSGSPAAGAEFMSISLPRVKFGDATKDDGDKNIVQTLPFTALYNDAGGAATATEQTTIYLQDSAA